MGSAGKPRRLLIIVENLPVPFDRRVWQEATTLRRAGYEVSVICPAGRGYAKGREVIDGVHVYRHRLPLEAAGAAGYAVEYGAALFWQCVLAWRVFFGRGFDAIHACNPPDTVFLVSLLFKPLGKRFVFDHHDISPELYEAKFGRRGVFYKLLLWLERMTFRTADVSIATNESYRRIAVERGRMDPQRVFVVRSGPDLARLQPRPPDARLKRGRRYLVGYVGVMGKQEGIGLLLQAVDYIVHEVKRRDVQFGLVGGGTELEAMRARARRLGIDEYVTFTGRVPDEQMLAVLSTAEVCVNPDVANELNDKSTMNKIMEYMALGKPMVQFDLTEGRFSAGEASLYAARNDPVDLAKKILALLDDPARRRHMAEYGRRRVEQELAWDFEAPKLLQAYNRLFDEAGAARGAPRPRYGASGEQE